MAGYQKVTPNPQRLVDEPVGEDYIVLTQRPTYQSEAAWRSPAERPEYIKANKLRFLRPYQRNAVHSLQRAVSEGKDRFLFEMATGTGTGKTLTAAAVIKLFLRTGNARRALFLVDRLELEDQAKKAFTALLCAEVQTLIYKGNRDDWRRSEIVVTTVQSLLSNNKYQRLFSPTDFAVEAGQWDRVIDYINREVFDKPEEYYNLDKLRKAAAVDRRLTLREILEKIFGLIPRFKSKDELLEEEFAKFVADCKPEASSPMPAIKTYFKAYATSGRVRDIIDSGQLTDLATNPMFSTRDFKAVPPKYRSLVPAYVKDYVPLNQFM